MKYSFRVLLLVLLVVGCNASNSAPKKPRYKNALVVSEDGFQFTVKQRDTIEIPSEKGEIMLNIDDITKGQTKVQIWGGDQILFLKSMRLDQSANFDIHVNSYTITCISLINKAIGIDKATFVIHLSSKSSPQAERLAQKEKILRLINLVRTSDITFIRNGDAHTGEEAAKHLLGKYEYAQGKVQTYAQFIEHIASKSSMSGKPYKVRKKNGQEINAVKWYEEVLAK